ncbi:unnamed protein product [Cylindrotheca closterium]|uniref:Uncharacterized protein n=1 Tax=Cylindrotheca closterium TaxID=2856 RepID=A0AAD2CTJ6_9STRA|nr:unnamed protein product [Cylindrotheca closterium]
MGKSITAKASSAMTKKLGVSKMKTTSVAKKAVKKRVEIDLQQPKDRDPINSKLVSETQTEEKRVADDNEVQCLADEIEATQIAEREARRSGHYDSIVPNLSEGWMQNLYSGDAVDEALERHDRIHTGNALFIAWEERFPGAWNQPCLRYDDPFNNNTGTATCEDHFARIFTSMNLDNSQLTKYLIAAFDTETMEFEDKLDDNHFFSGEMNNPRLCLEHPLVGFWLLLICSKLFDYPWINEFLLEYYDDPPSAIVDAIKQRRSDKSKKAPPNQELVKEPDPPCIQKIYDSMYSIDKPGTDVQRNSASSAGKTQIALHLYKVTMTRPTVVEVKSLTRANIVDDAMEEDDDDERVNSDGKNPHDEAMDDNTSPLISHNLTATQDSAGTGTLMEPSETTPPCVQRPSTLAKRISNLIQVNMEGVPGKCHIFETTFSVDYQRLDSGTVAEASAKAVQDYLHTGLRQLGRGAGCYPSPLQYGEIVKIGSCSFIPAEVNFSANAKELMRLFDFEVPIGIKMDWISIPYMGRAKCDERSPGVTSPHCFTWRIHAKRVDCTLRLILHPASAKPDFPFAAPATYMSDWKLAQQGLLSVKAYGLVKDAILTLIRKLRDYYILTDVLYPGINFTGIFKFATTRLYGSCTLFKLLLSIKATPAQADQAFTAGKDKPSPTTANDDSSEEEDNNESQEGAVSLSGAFTKVTKKKKKKKKKKLPLPITSRIIFSKICPLFLMILPGEMEGSYIFVCHKKYGQLARNMLRGIVPFLIHHLCELTDMQADRVLGKWINGFPNQRSRQRVSTKVEEALEFLDDVIEDTTNVYQGQLSIDMDMANAKDIDNGQTVTGMLDEMQEREQQLEDAFLEIEACDNALAAKDQALAQQKAKITALQAQLDALQRQTVHHLAINLQPLAQNNEVSPHWSKFTTPPKKRKSKDILPRLRGALTGLRLVLSRPLSQLAPARLFTSSSRSSGLRKSLRRLPWQRPPLSPFTSYLRHLPEP